MAKNWHCVDRWKGKCGGEIQLYCCTDSPFRPLCDIHAPVHRFVMRDGDALISRNYYETVYLKKARCCAIDSQHCTPDVDEYYGTDGGLGFFCRYHLTAEPRPFVVWDDPEHPITRRYDFDVYSPYDEEDEVAYRESLRRVEEQYPESR